MNNRIIKFRGKDLSGNWYYGHLTVLTVDAHNHKKGSYISNSVGMPFAYAIRPDTVGQSTGLTDKNGKEIYENDVIESTILGVKFKGQVIWETCGFRVTNDDMDITLGNDKKSKRKVLGNIFENPELLI